jgi:hypothetical protein
MKSREAGKKRHLAGTPILCVAAASHRPPSTGLGGQLWGPAASNPTECPAFSATTETCGGPVFVSSQLDNGEPVTFVRPPRNPPTLFERNGPFTPPTHSKWPPWISTTSFGRLTRPSMPYPKKSAISKSSPAPGSPRDLHPSSCRMALCPGSRLPFAACQHALIQHEKYTAGLQTASSSASMTTSSSRSRRSRR